MIDSLVPKENIEIYCYLYCIETALRELIIDSLKKIGGIYWYKKRLSGPILDKYRNGREYEKNVKWTQIIPHHPIYYIDFPHLKDIIVRADNWKDAFKDIFRHQDILKGTLSELEFIRNKIAHNRKTTKKDIKIIKGAYTKLSEAISEKRFNELARRCTCALDIPNRLKELQKESEKSYIICKDYKLLEKLAIWNSIHNEWWFDDSFLGNNLDGIIIFFKTLEQYTRLPRERGSGYKIEAWVKSCNLEIKYSNAQKNFSLILKSM